MAKLEKRLDAAFFIVLLAAYAYWLFTEASQSIAAIIVSAVVCLLFGLLGAATIGSVLSSMYGSVEVELKECLGRRSLRVSKRHPMIQMILILVMARFAVYVAAYILYTAKYGYQGGLLDTMGLWLKGDAPHYMGIAENWYVTAGDPRFHIVFFPFYPILVRIISIITNNTFAAGLLCSTICTIVSCLLLYELALLDMDRAAATRAVKYQLLLPASFLLAAPMSDALFLMLSILCMLLTRKKQYALACIVGGLASFTRVLGVVLVAPVLVEMLGDAVRMKMETGRLKKFLLTRLPLLLLIFCGLLMYLYVNYQVTGNAFTFLKYQSEHWNQRMGWFFNTAAYQTEYFFNTIVVDQPAAFGLWLPNLLFLIGAPLAMLVCQRPRKVRVAQGLSQEPQRQPYSIRASYLAYFLAYYFAGMGATWLLSAPRYLICCFPLSIALAGKERSRGGTVLLYGVLLVLQLMYLGAYVAGWPVY